MKYSPYSYSKISCWNSCAKKFYFQYIVKPKIKVKQVHLQRGKLIHGLIESIIQNNVKSYNTKQFNLEKDDLDKSISIVKNFCSTNNFRSIATSKCIKLTEKKFFLDNQLNPVKTKNESLILGYIDLLCVYSDNKVNIFDWKTGGKDIGSINAFPLSQYQFEIYSIYALQEFQKTVANCHYAYVEHDHFVNHEIFLNDIDVLKHKVLENIRKIEEDTNFQKNITNLCNWCDFKQLCKPVI